MIVGETRKGPRSPADGGEPTARERERERSTESATAVIILIDFELLQSQIKIPFWLVTPDFLVFLPLIPKPCYTGAETRDEEAGTPPCNPPSQRRLRSWSSRLHQALMDMKLEQEDRFRLQAQDEDRRAIWSLLGQEENPVAAPSIAHVPLMRLGPHDDPEAFVDLFKKTAEACGCARTQWPVRLIPLLTGEAQVAAQQLPVANLLAYEDLKRAILQRVGRIPEQHRQRFRSVELGDSGRPFVMAQQLRDACRKWLMAEPSKPDAAEGIEYEPQG